MLPIKTREESIQLANPLLRLRREGNIEDRSIVKRGQGPRILLEQPTLGFGSGIPFCNDLTNGFFVVHSFGMSTRYGCMKCARGK
jgi:hypothetical protein